MLWLSILETRALNVAVGDAITTVPQTNGIRPPPQAQDEKGSPPSEPGGAS